MCRKKKTFAQRSAEVELLLKRRSIKGGEDKEAAVDRAPVDKALVHVMDLSDRVLQDYQCKSWQEPQLRELLLDLKTLNTEDLTQGTDQLMIKPLEESHGAHKAQVQEEDLITALGEIHRVVRAQAQEEDLAATQAQEECPMKVHEGDCHLGEHLAIHPPQL